MSRNSRSHICKCAPHTRQRRPAPTWHAHARTHAFDACICISLAPLVRASASLIGEIGMGMGRACVSS
eukprot:scaffold5190_cov113-Isochrysis_galbana.AAC.1